MTNHSALERVPNGGLGNDIRRVRCGTEMSLRELSRRCDVSVGFLSDVERGRRIPNLTMLRRIWLQADGKKATILRWRKIRYDQLTAEFKASLDREYAEETV